MEALSLAPARSAERCPVSDWALAGQNQAATDPSLFQMVRLAI